MWKNKKQKENEKKDEGRKLIEAKEDTKKKKKEIKIKMKDKEKKASNALEKGEEKIKAKKRNEENKVSEAYQIVVVNKESVWLGLV